MGIWGDEEKEFTLLQSWIKIQRDPGTLIQYASQSLAKVCILPSVILTFSIIHKTFTSPSEIIKPDLLIYYSFLQNSLQPLE